MPQHRLEGQSTEHGIHGDAGVDQNAALGAVVVQQEGGHMGEEDRPQARDRPREAGGPTPAQLEVGVDRQRGGRHGQAQADAIDRRQADDVLPEGGAEGRQEDAHEGQRGAGQGHLPEREPPEHGAVDDACRDW